MARFVSGFMTRPHSDFDPRAIIDSGALQHNLQVVRARAPHSKVLAVIKANGYGHGLVTTARALAKADALGVARLSEGLLLREHGLTQDLVLLEGVFTADELQAAATRRMQLVVHSPEQLALLQAWRGNPVQVWLKIDTGMNRLGLPVADFAAVWRQLTACNAVQGKPRIMTHLASADEPDTTRTSQQLQRFAAIADTLGVERSICNSAGLLSQPAAQVEWVRPGLMLYGISPFADHVGSDLDLRPVMTLRTRLIAVRQLAGGDEVGYGATWRAAQPTRIGIAAVGYGDGYPRQIGNGAPVMVDGKQCAIAGRVSMDMIAINLVASPTSTVGSDVVLWGNELPVERMAECAGTIPYELVCGISQRVAVQMK
jgi:alanine racemase